MKKTPISEIMNRHVTCVSPNDMLYDTVSIMVKMNYSCVVVNIDKRPVGIITERDVIHIIQKTDDSIKKLKVKDYMNPTFICVHETDNIIDVLEISYKRKGKHFVIVNDINELEGIVTHTDLVDHYLHYLREDNSIDAKTAELLASNEELKAMALQDPLLGIGNRRAMEIDLERIHSQFLRYGNDYVVALFDIDYFKKYNDHFGHIAGDRTLRRVADTLKSNLRKTDYIYRYGGEEILVIYPQTDLEQARIVCCRMCETLVNMQIPHPLSPMKILTVSGGLAHCNAAHKEDLDWRTIISEADNFLYAAKANGRNRIEPTS